MSVPKNARVKPNSYPRPGATGNTQGIVLPKTDPGPPGGNVRPPVIPETPEEKNFMERGVDRANQGIDDWVEGKGDNKLAMAAGATAKAAIAVFVPTALWELVPVGKGAKLLKKSGELAGVVKKTDKTTEAAKDASTAKKADGPEKNHVKKGPKPKCGGRATYARQAGDFAGNQMERDHVPSFAALKEALLKYAKENGYKLDDKDKKILFGETEAANRTGDSGKLGRHAQTIAVPDEVHKKGRTHGSKNNPNQVRGDAGDLQGAAKKDNAAHRKNINNDKHKDCAAALNQAANEIDSITNDQYEKFFDKLIQDTKKGKNTVNPWKGIL